MHSINIHQAKTHFSKLLEEVIQGNEVIIAKAGKPIAIIIPFPKPKSCRFGVLKNQIKIGSDFDSPLPDSVLNDFED